MKRDVIMTGRAFFSRCAWLTVALICAGALHLALSLNAQSIATPLVKAYVPLTKEVAAKQAIEACNGSVRRYSEDCSMPSESSVLTWMERDKANYEYQEVQPVARRVRDATDVGFGMVYAALALGALWAFKTWFAVNVWPRLVSLVGPLQASLNLSETRATRRLRRAQEEFRTLKSLRDDGLIGEELFVARKNKLKAAISPVTTGKS